MHLCIRPLLKIITFSQKHVLTQFSSYFIKMDNHTLLQTNQNSITATPKKQCDRCHETFNASSFARHVKICPFAAFKLSKNQLLDLEISAVTPHPSDNNKDLIKDEQVAKLTQQLEEIKKELASMRELNSKTTPHPKINFNLSDYEEKFEVFRSRLRNDQQAIYVWTEFKKFILETGKHINLDSGNTFVARLNNKVKTNERFLCQNLSIPT